LHGDSQRVQFCTDSQPKGKVTEKTLQKTLGETLGKTPEKRSEKIIALLRADGSLSIQALAEQIGKTTRTVERTFRQLRDTGIIKRIGPDRGGHWIVKEKP